MFFFQPVSLKQYIKGLKATKRYEENEMCKLFTNVMYLKPPKVIALSSTNTFRNLSFLCLALLLLFLWWRFMDPLVICCYQLGIFCWNISSQSESLDILNQSSYINQIRLHRQKNIKRTHYHAFQLIIKLLDRTRWFNSNTLWLQDQDLLKTFVKQIEEDRITVISEGNLSEMHKVHYKNFVEASPYFLVQSLMFYW